MFSARKRPLLLVADRLLSLRVSLNTPVVATPDLPAGPARAAIAVHSEAGRTCFTVAVRSLRNGESVLYELEGEDPNDASGIAVALDAALSFGESMGFLFDDELVTERSEGVLRGALAQLRELVTPPPPDVGETAPFLETDPLPEEILLDELDLEPAPAPAPRAKAPAKKARSAPKAPDPRPAVATEADREAAKEIGREAMEEAGKVAAEPAPPAPRPPVAVAPTAPAPAAPPAPAPAVPERAAPAPAAPTLTKFRHVAAAGDAGSTAPPERPAPAPPAESARPADTGARAGRTGGALLGRVKPVRLRSPDAPAPIPALLRLLSGF
jgi:hypothetical protein